MTDWGHFPFGRPNTPRPLRRASAPTEVLVIGVYPSAWHVCWTAPKCGKGIGARGRINALAADVEPKVFWAGDRDADDFASRVKDWCSEVGFARGDSPGQNGQIGQYSPPANGSSGKGVVAHYLDPLKADIDTTSFTDIFPVFMVKYSDTVRTQPRKRRQQGDAIREDYDSLAHLMGMQMATLPARFSRKELPHRAIEYFRDKLHDEYVETKPSLVISLGEEVWSAVRMWPGFRATHPVAEFRKLEGPQYGERGEIVADGHSAEWLPLVHPGLLRHAGVLRQVSGSWEHLHASWEERMCGGEPVAAADRTD